VRRVISVQYTEITYVNYPMLLFYFTEYLMVTNTVLCQYSHVTVLFYGISNGY
jgi:hypothetical protein